MASAYTLLHGAANSSHFTVTALGRWSSLNKQLPAVDKIKALHVYDFDNTLFKTPTPNPQVWFGATYGKLLSPHLFVNGGWWHDSRVLAATGQGLEKEEPRAWAGCWNEKVVQLVELSIKQPDALCVLLTGRAEKAFTDLVKKMVASKGLEFDMVCLKPQVSPTNQHFQNTMHFKQLFLNALMETYKYATEIKIYEDRPKHTRGFRDFFAEYNRRQALNPTRGPLAAEAFQVADDSTSLDPVVEVAVVRQMMQDHNESLQKAPPDLRQPLLEIKKTVCFTGYMISPDDTKKIRGFAHIPHDATGDLKHYANSILICPRPCPPSILAKVGGMGSKMLWEVTGTGSLNENLWAARVRPVPSTAVYHTDNPIPLVVLSMRRGARPTDACNITNWQPLPPNQSFVFETTVGEKSSLRVEQEDPGEDEYESLFANKSTKRKREGNDDWAPRNPHGYHGGRNETRGFHSGGRGGGRGRGGGNAGRGMRNTSRGGGRGARGRGGFHSYRSLDDVEPRNEQGGYGPQVDYDDAYQPPSHFQALPTGPRALQGRGALQQGRGVGQPAGRPMGGGPATGNPDLQNLY
ncbi:hypothetical protein HRG_011117 [Hirsutella rhossiliensis]|uniref:Swiss Army Knife RNA repair protein HAD domain-containing protein n=1 Tax=Hirsutella rhossiliensis TaxID=111463 RepID=A0A9P8SDJ4_9HYPO|nr:uncharacterized protein HRG_11117 [Hirsutella rhossiliensis]KAH0958024.1 hypothetical protein HRG_11117 [Hirsutella rhossiliensis]